MAEFDRAAYGCAIEAAAEALRSATFRWDDPEVADKAARIAVEAAAPHLHTWESVRAYIDEHYPADVFDGSSGDDGARIVALLRRAEKAEEDLAVTRGQHHVLLTKLQRAEAEVERLRRALSGPG